MILLLLGAAVMTVALGDAVDTAVIILVVLLNTTVGVVQQVRAERAVSAVRSLAAPQASVMRDGRRVVVPAAEVVPDDLILLDAGDVVPTDGRLVVAAALQVDESALTGESAPVDKSAGCGDGDDSVGQCYAGTVVTRGRGQAIVTRTGLASSLGRIAALIAAQPRRPTPLQRRLSELSTLLAIAALGLSAVVLGLGLLRGEPLGDMVITAIALAVAAVPESLPAVVTFALALGAYRMAQRNAIVRRLPAVETLGAVTVIASDKTGTLTEGRMVAERTWTAAGVDADSLLRDVVLCNDASLRSATGDPMEVALLVAAADAGMDPAELRARYPRISEIPFDSSRRRMTTVHTFGDEWLAICKGAPEVVLDPQRVRACDHDTAAEARRVAEQLAKAGYRVLAVAERRLDTRPSTQNIEHELHVVGLIGIADPPRAAAAKAVRAFDAAGVRLMLITGDHPTTALAVAQRVGLVAADGSDAVVTGADLDEGVPAESITQTTVFARTRPEQKLDIVSTLQDLGHVVAMTGDGVNDGPALRRADIGVAMGHSGTEVARQAADLVLLDDELGTVAGAIEEGRRIYANVRRFLRYALSGGLAEVVVMLAGPFLGMGVTLRPAQILWINMITHGLPGVAIGAEPADPDVMRSPPRPPDESVVGAGLSRQIGWTGALIALVALGIGGWGLATDRPWQTLIFVTLGAAQLMLALALRPRRLARNGASRFLDVAVGGALLLQLAAVYLPPLQALVSTEPLSAADLVAALSIAAVPALVVLVISRGHERKETR